MKALSIRDAEIVANGSISRGTIIINNDRIDDVITDGRPVPETAEVLDASRLLVFPGAIDDHVHFRDPGLTHKADMASESAAAVAGGVTSVMDMPNTNPQTTTEKALREKLDYAQRTMHTNFSAYIGVTNDNLNEVLNVDYSDVCGIKVFMGSSTGGMLVDKEDALRQLFANAPTIIAAHCEDEAIIRANSERAKSTTGDNTQWIQHPEIRSSEACYASSSKAASLARETGAHLHIMHITTERELALLDSGDNRHITGEACPAHLWFTDKDYDRLGPFIKCNPAIKSPNDRDALRRAVAQGLITTIGTDHAPHTKEEKTGHSYWQTPSGMPMIQHSLTLMLRLADEGWWDYPTVAAMMAENVADRYGICQRGHIAPGQFADLAIVAKRPQTISNAMYKCGWTPLQGENLNHTVVRTYVSGQLAFDGSVRPTLGQKMTFDFNR